MVFATARGAVAACDPLLIRGVIFGELGAKPDPKGFYAEMVASKELRTPVTWQSIAPTAYDALLLPGGHAQGTKQLLDSELLQEKVGAFAATGKRPGSRSPQGLLPAALHCASRFGAIGEFRALALRAAAQIGGSGAGLGATFTTVGVASGAADALATGASASGAASAAATTAAAASGAAS